MPFCRDYKSDEQIYWWLSITSAIVIIVFGILVMLLGHTLFRTIKYDYDISIFFFIGIMYFIITLLLMTQVYGFCNRLYYSFYSSYWLHSL